MTWTLVRGVARVFAAAYAFFGPHERPPGRWFFDASPETACRRRLGPPPTKRPGHVLARAGRSDGLLAKLHLPARKRNRVALHRVDGKDLLRVGGHPWRILRRGQRRRR